MDTKEQPPTYSQSGETAPHSQHSQPPQNMNQYPAQPNYAQANYGFSPQPTNFGNQPSGVVVQQVQASGQAVYNTPPQDYTTQAWLACLLCFWPTGLMAIFKANESRDALARGDMVGAHQASNNARQFVRISYVVGGISLVLLVVIIIVYAVMINNITSGTGY